MIKKLKGFPGEIIIVLPEKIIEEIKKNQLINSLYITDVGYFPKAKFHYRDRHKGILQHILIYNLEGKGKIKIDQNEYEIHPNQFFVIPAKMPHTYFADEKNPWSIYWIHFEGEKSDLFSKIFGHLNIISPSPIARTKERTDLFSEILANLSMGYSKENIEYVNLCLWHLLASFMYITQFRQILSGKNIDVISRSIHYMQENINTPLKLEQIANEINYSPSHFSKIFSQKTGQTPMEYFNHLKMQEACRWLDTSSSTIQNISVQLGYSDQFYFSRVFKRIMGQSPIHYRKRNNN